MAEETEKQKVDTRDLAMGMYVSELDRPWIESPFMFQGFLITNDQELTQLSQSCNYVYVDVVKSKVEVPSRLVMSASSKKAPFPKKKAAPGGTTFCIPNGWKTYPQSARSTPAATAEPITPATFGPMACMSR